MIVAARTLPPTGRRFVGRHVARERLAQGWHVRRLVRGRSEPPRCLILEPVVRVASLVRLPTGRTACLPGGHGHLADRPLHPQEGFIDTKAVTMPQSDTFALV